MAAAMWGRDEAEIQARLEAWNRPIHQIRARIEKIFGTWKRSYGLRRMRWRGLAKAGVQIRLTAHRLQYEAEFEDRFRSRVGGNGINYRRAVFHPARLRNIEISVKSATP